MLVIAMGCSPRLPVEGTDASIEQPPPDAGREDAGTSGDAGGSGDAGLFEINQPRDAGAPVADSGLPWSWAAVQEVLSTPPSGGGVVTGRWVPVVPASAVDRAWAGGVLLFDGGVVGIPFNESTALFINPANDTTERWPVAGGAVEEGWEGGVLLPNGKVIAFPLNADRFLLIDPATRTAAPFGDDLSGSGGDGGTDKFRGGVLGLNGMVYAAPSSAMFVARLNPTTGVVTRLPIPPTALRGGTVSAVLFPTGDIAMFPGTDSPGLLIIPSRTGGEDEVWFLARPPTPGAPAFSGGGVITGIDTAVAVPQQNGFPLRYEAGLLTWDTPVAGVSERIANAWYFGAWSTNGHFYAPPYGADRALSFTLGAPAAEASFQDGPSLFRSVFGAVGLPDGRILCMPHSRSSWLELTPAGRRTMSMEAFTSPFLNKL